VRRDLPGDDLLTYDLAQRWQRGAPPVLARREPRAHSRYTRRAVRSKIASRSAVLSAAVSSRYTSTTSA